MTESRTRTRRRQQTEDTHTITVNANWLLVGLVVIIALAGVGFAGWYVAQSDSQTTTASTAPQSGQFTAFQEQSPSQDTSTTQAVEEQPATQNHSADSQFLGPETDVEGLGNAEAGSLGEPALVWFHADWCHVCQSIKPTVAQMEKKWDGKVDLVRLNVDHPEAREAVRKYGVRGTPTFLFITRSGKIMDTTVGWPGQGRVEQAMTEMLTLN
ncbi:MAG: Thioredoxin [Anaerolineales bacterium]|nr:Thioredoxin [Anaerolineales bacterium]